MIDIETLARQNHKSGYNCSQSVAAAFSEIMGISESEAKTSAPAPRSNGGKCGALLAAEMVMDRLSINGKDELEKKFAAENGAIECSKLRSPEIRKVKNCNDFVGSAARIVEEIMSESK